jgi:hypothetical protein
LHGGLPDIRAASTIGSQPITPRPP